MGEMLLPCTRVDPVMLGCIEKGMRAPNGALV
jgi:hypothetical protein